MAARQEIAESDQNSKVTTPPPAELLRLIEPIGQFIEYWGFRRIDGMVWALVYLSPKPLSGQEIAEKLGMSKGMASISIHTLLEYKVIESVSRGWGRTTYYDSVADLNEAILNVLRIREAEMLSQAKMAAANLKKVILKESISDQCDSKRLTKLTKMIERGHRLLKLVLKTKIAIS